MNGEKLTPITNKPSRMGTQSTAGYFYACIW